MEEIAASLSATTDQDPFEELHRLEETFYREGFALGNADGEYLGRSEGRVFGTKRACDRFFDMARMHGHSLVLGNRLASEVAEAAGQLSGGGGGVGDNDDDDDDAQAARGELANQAHNDDGSQDGDQDPRDAEEDEEGEKKHAALLAGLRHRALKPLAAAGRQASSTSDGSGGGHSGGAAAAGAAVGGAAARLERHVRALYALSEPASLSTVNGEDEVSAFDDRFRRARAKETILARMLPAEEAAPMRMGAAAPAQEGSAG